jgi:hypothetical protein
LKFWYAADCKNLKNRYILEILIVDHMIWMKHSFKHSSHSRWTPFYRFTRFLLVNISRIKDIDGIPKYFVSGQKLGIGPQAFPLKQLWFKNRFWTVVFYGPKPVFTMVRVGIFPELKNYFFGIHLRQMIFIYERWFEKHISPLHDTIFSSLLISIFMIKSHK